MFTLADAAGMLRAADDILIFCHIRPDGDAAGSAGALCMALRRLGKTAFVAPHERVMERFQPYIVPFFAPADFVPRFLVSVDTPGAGQYPSGMEAFAPVTDLALDHHGKNAAYAKHTYVEGEAAACGEIVYLLLNELGIGPDEAIAEALYCALATDTGCFRTRATTARTMAIAAKLRETGFDAYTLTHRLFEVKTPARVKLEAEIAQATEYPAADTACVVVTQAMLDRCGTREDDLDKISMLLTVCEGVRFGLMLRELPGGRWKVSVRTDGSVHAGDVASIFPGGGGHPDSGGAAVAGRADEIMAALLERLDAQKGACNAGISMI